MTTRILVIGGTGAMGSAVVRRLAADPSKVIDVFTRDKNSDRVVALVSAGSGRIHAVGGDLNDHDSLVTAMRGVDGVFCNTDFWSSASPQKEFEQGVRALNAAKAADVKHFVWSSLDNAVVLTDGKVPVPHFDSKAAVEAWIGLMKSEEFMQKDAAGWFSNHVSVLVTAPYFENLQFRAGPKFGRLSDGRDGFLFNLALGKGRYPMISLLDIAWFAAYLFDHRDQSVGKTLRVVADALSGHSIASQFEEQTGIPAEFRDVALDSLKSAMPETGHDVAGMFQFFQEYDIFERARDIEKLKAIHPELLTYRNWLAKTGWRGEPVEVQKKAVVLVSHDR